MTSIHDNNNQIKINNLKPKISVDNNNKDENFEESISQLKQNMLNRCEYEIPDFGDFARIKTTIPNKDKNIYAGECSLICEPSEDNSTKRYLSYHQMNPQNVQGLMCLIGSGTKDEIIETLKDEKIIEQIKEAAERMSEKMKEMKW